MQHFKFIKTVIMEPIWIWNHHWPNNRKRSKDFIRGIYPILPVTLDAKKLNKTSTEVLVKFNEMCKVFWSNG